MMPPKSISPYITGNPVMGERFFGRSELLEVLQQEFEHSQNTSVVVFGQRRIGKTSLLKEFQRLYPTPEGALFPVYFDLYSYAKEPLSKVLRELVKAVSRRLGGEVSFDIPSDTTMDSWFVDVFLPNLVKHLSDRCRPVFLFDEFDVLDPHVALPQDDVAAKTLLPFLISKLSAQHSAPAFVFAIGRRTTDLQGEDFKMLFRTARSLELWTLDRNSALALIKQSEATESLYFTEAAVTQILELTAGHAYLTQQLCQRVWDNLVFSHPDSPPTADAADINAAVDGALEAGGPAIDWIWGGLTAYEKIYASALAQYSKNNEPMSEAQVQHILKEHATRLKGHDLESVAPQNLVKWRILEDKGGDKERKYCFAVKLFHRWLQLNKPLKDVKLELDKENPLSNALFEAGNKALERHEYDKAIKCFQDALEENPQNFRARLYLGKARFESGDLDTALETFAEAYIQDKTEAQASYAIALLQKARQHFQSSELEACRQLCQTGLKVSQGSIYETELSELYNTVLCQEGDQKFLAYEFKQALAFYQSSPAPDSTLDKRIQMIRVLDELYRLEKDALLLDKLARLTELTENVCQNLAIFTDDPLKHFISNGLQALSQQFIGTLKSTRVPFTENWHEIIKYLRILLDGKLMLPDNYHFVIKSCLYAGKYQDALEFMDTLLSQSATYKQAGCNEFFEFMRSNEGTEKDREFMSRELIASYPDCVKNWDSRLKELEDKAREQMTAEQYEEAYSSYEAIYHSAIHPQTRELCQTNLNFCKKQKNFSRLFEDALKAKSNHNYSGAIHKLIQLITADPYYQQEDLYATSVLDEVIKTFPLGKSTPPEPMFTANYSTDIVAEQNIDSLHIERQQQLLHEDMALKARTICYSPHGDYLIVLCHSGVSILDAAQLQPAFYIPAEKPMSSITVCPYSEKLAIGSNNGEIRCYRLDARQQEMLPSAYFEKHTKSVNALAFLFDGEVLVSADSSSVYFWDVSEATVWSETLTVEGRINSLAVFGDFIALGTGDAVQLFEVNTLKPLAAFPHPKPVWDISFAPRGKTLATASSDSVIRIWNYETKALVHELEGHEQRIHTVQYSPDGLLLASGSQDKTLRLWAPHSAEKSPVFQQEINREIMDITFSPDGRVITTLSMNEVCMWIV